MYLRVAQWLITARKAVGRVLWGIGSSKQIITTSNYSPPKNCLIIVLRQQYSVPCSRKRCARQVYLGLLPQGPTTRPPRLMAPSPAAEASSALLLHQMLQNPKLILPFSFFINTTSFHASYKHSFHASFKCSYKMSAKYNICP